MFYLHFTHSHTSDSGEWPKICYPINACCWPKRKSAPNAHTYIHICTYVRMPTKAREGKCWKILFSPAILIHFSKFIMQKRSKIFAPNFAPQKQKRTHHFQFFFIFIFFFCWFVYHFCLGQRQTRAVHMFLGVINLQLPVMPIQHCPSISLNDAANLPGKLENMKIRKLTKSLDESIRFSVGCGHRDGFRIKCAT